MRRFITPLLLSLAIIVPGLLAASGCMGRGHVRGTMTVRSQPRLVHLGPGVWVIEDHHQPVFYSDGYYWRYDTGHWYRSDVHTRGWVRVRGRVVPRPVRGIDRPRRYIRYHAPNDARTRRGPPKVRDHRRNERVPARRDHRDADRTPRRGPETRDHRDNDNRGRRGPKTRDHRDDNDNRGRRGPKTRDHRDDDDNRGRRGPKTRDHRDDDDDKRRRRGPRTRDHRDD